MPRFSTRARAGIGGTGQLSMGGTWNVAIHVAEGAKDVATRHTSIVAKE